MLVGHGRARDGGDVARVDSLRRRLVVVCGARGRHTYETRWLRASGTRCTHYMLGFILTHMEQ
eukprot:6666944-Prymnesium_polylepis.1